jgi:hypothetical protein
VYTRISLCVQNSSNRLNFIDSKQTISAAKNIFFYNNLLFGYGAHDKSGLPALKNHDFIEAQKP